MSTARERQLITVVAIVVLVATIATTWQIADVRAAQADQKRATDLVAHQVQARQATADYDGDGIEDATDQCPTRPETVNGFMDGDGCPDVVATTGAS